MSARPLAVVRGNHDPLGLDNTGYEPDGYYVASTDRRGHFDQFNVKVPQGLMGHIWTIINETAEYRSVQDFLRDAVVHLIHKRNETIGDDQISEGVELEIAAAKMENIRRTIERRKTTVTEAIEAIKAAVDARDTWAAQQALEEAAMTVEILPEPYKTELANEIARYQNY